MTDYTSEILQLWLGLLIAIVLIIIVMLALRKLEKRVAALERREITKASRMGPDTHTHTRTNTPPF